MTPDPIFLTFDEVLRLHRESLDRYGGQEGFNNEGLVRSAVEMPRQRFAGQYLHEDLAAMASAYLFHIAESQGFTDGNKRAAVASAIAFLALNGHPLRGIQAELYDVTIGIAEHRMGKEDVAEFFRQRLR